MDKEIILLAHKLKDKCDSIECYDCPFNNGNNIHLCDLDSFRKTGVNYSPYNWESEHLK